MMEFIGGAIAIGVVGAALWVLAGFLAKHLP